MQYDNKRKNTKKYTDWKGTNETVWKWHDLLYKNLKEFTKKLLE